MIYKKIEIAVDGYKETADLYTYFLDNSIEMHINRKRPVVVICPGGGYAMTSDREAEPIVMQYLAKGYHTVTDDCVPVENSLLFFNASRTAFLPSICMESISFLLFSFLEYPVSYRTFFLLCRYCCSRMVLLF